MKKILYYLGYGIAWGMTFSVVINLIGYFIVGPSFIVNLSTNYPQQVLAYALSGIVCASTSIVYTFDNLSYKKQMLIHFSVGVTGYILIAAYAGWIVINNSFMTVLVILFCILGFTIIWFCFYLYYYFEAKLVNKKINEMNTLK